MSIAPLRKSVHIDAPPERAFDILTKAGSCVVFEPRVGGRWYERAPNGTEVQWGRVLAWEPPERLLLAWQVNAALAFDPDLETEVEITFTAEGAGTRVEIEHRNLERLGVGADRFGTPDIYAAFAAKLGVG
jgi:uncharacterized protein YndB with AHSA1/START domain